MHIKLDIVFIVDVTGSMGSFIGSAKSYLRDSMKKYEASGIDASYSLILYRDHPPQDNSFASRIFLDNGSAEELHTALRHKHFAASGGGDAPESGLDAIMELHKLSFRRDSIRYAFIIGDAPLHGAYPNSNACTCGLTIKDVRTVLEKMSIVLIGIPLTRHTHFDRFCDEIQSADYDGVSSITDYLMGLKDKINWAVDNVFPILTENSLTTNTELSKMLNVPTKTISESIELLNLIGITDTLI